MTVDHTGGRSNGESAQRLEILLADYQTCREDERVLYSIQAGVFSVAVTLIGLMAAAVTQTCDFSSAKSCVSAPDYILAATPLIPIALLAYTTMLGVTGTLRSYYLRGLEDEIRKHVHAPIASLGDIRPASFVGIVTEIVSLRRGRLSYRLLANLVLAVVIIVFGGFTAYIGFHVARAEQVAMTVVYAGIAVLLVWQVSLGTIRGRTFFVQTAQRFLDRRGDTALPEVRVIAAPRPSTNERGLIAYLILPRPEDWVKWLIAPGVFLATAWSLGNAGKWPAFLALWFILEYLIYSARYQWNDVRGIEEDQAHSARRARRRLPAGLSAHTARRNILISLAVAAIRLIAAFAVGQALGLGKPALAMLVLVFAIAIVYEGLRSISPPSASAGPGPPVVAVWCVVGLGYGVRAGLGLIAGGLAATNSLTWIGISCFAVFGIMFVLLTWVLEAASFCYIDGSGIWNMKSGMPVKAHLITLLRYVPVSLVQAGTAISGQTSGTRGHPAGTHVDGGRQRILVARGPVLAPWNIALTASAALGGLLGLGLAHAAPGYTSKATMVALSLGAAGVLVLCETQAMRLAITGAGAVVLIGAAIPFGAWPYTLLAAGPWLAVASLYFFFRGSSYQDLKDFGPNLLKAVSSVKIALHLGPLLLRVVIGGRAWLAGGFAGGSQPTRTSGNPSAPQATPSVAAGGSTSRDGHHTQKGS